MIKEVKNDQSPFNFHVFGICTTWYLFFSVSFYLFFLPLYSLPILQGVGTGPSPLPGCRGLVESDVWVEWNHVTTNRKLQICFSNELRKSVSWSYEIFIFFNLFGVGWIVLTLSVYSVWWPGWFSLKRGHVKTRTFGREVVQRCKNVRFLRGRV